jgi:acetyl esterase/lipase
MFDCFRRISLICTVTASCLLPAHAQKVTKDITYTASPDDKQTADLYEPSGPGPFPAIVFIHGGSWRSGNKNEFHALAADLAAQGYAGFSINYDLHPHSFPVSFQEAQTAVRFLRTHAGEYHIDPNQIVVAGESAGGQLAALVALATGDSSTAVSAAIIFNGAYRLSPNIGVIARYLGVKREKKPRLFKDASPFSQIHPGAPPFFVGHGTADHLVPYSEAELFIHALQEQHVPVTTYVATGGPHSYWKKSKFYAPNLAAVKTFLATTLQRTKPNP